MCPKPKTGDSSDKGRAAIACRHCGKALATPLGPNGPFCSHHCKMQDLSKWFSEGYRIAAGPAPMAPGEPEDAG